MASATAAPFRGLGSSLGDGRHGSCHSDGVPAFRTHRLSRLAGRGVVLPVGLLLVLASCAASPVSPATPGAAADARGPQRPGGAAVVQSSDSAADLHLDAEPTLAQLLRTALARSPVIAAARERATAAAETPAIAGALPNPKLMVGWYETEVETRVGPQRWAVGIRQPIPFPTKLTTKSEIAASEARRMSVVYQRAVRDVLVDVVRVAHELDYLDQAARITESISALLERYTVAASGAQTGSLVSELFRAETQRAQLENDRVILAELRSVEEQRLRSLLDLPPTAAIGVPRVGAVPSVRMSFPELLRIAEEHSQELREAGLALDAARGQSSLAAQSHVPDFSVGVTSIRTDRLPGSLGVNPDGNGKDPLILQLGVDLPVWVQRDEATIRRARGLERAAALDRVNAIQHTRDRVARAWFAVGNAERLHRLYADVLVPRADIAARTSEDLLASGKGSLAGVLETIAVTHNFRLAAARARADHGQAIAALERALGRPLDVLDTDAAEDVR